MIIPSRILSAIFAIPRETWKAEMDIFLKTNKAGENLELLAEKYPEFVQQIGFVGGAYAQYGKEKTIMLVNASEMKSGDKIGILQEIFKDEVSEQKKGAD
jgi:hypothetical protein